MIHSGGRCAAIASTGLRAGRIRRLSITTPVAAGDGTTRDQSQTARHRRTDPSSGLNPGCSACRVSMVDPQAHREAVLAAEQPREAPAHTRIAVVVDDPAEDVPGSGCADRGHAGPDYAVPPRPSEAAGGNAADQVGVVEMAPAQECGGVVAPLPHRAALGMPIGQNRKRRRVRARHHASGP